MRDINSLFDLWKKKALDEDVSKELLSIEGNDEQISDRFYKSLEFGTGGLRGVIGAGTNRMNIYTVGQATQGLADYLNEEFENPSVAIAYDSRIKSDIFAKRAAGVLAANGIKVHIYPELVPTPMLSFAVRHLHCSSGIIITASHNPSKYNGYKCYDPHGYQMTDDAANKTYEFIQKVDVFDGVKCIDFEEGIESGIISYIPSSVNEAFYDCVQSALFESDEENRLKLVYTPLNGTGYVPVRTILKRIGGFDVETVPEQSLPDGNFPTCPFPNPEIKQVFELAMEIGKKSGADLLLATDPDCDRVGIAVKAGHEYKLLTGNEVAVLLSEYLLSRRKELGTLPQNPVIVKSFVTTSMVDKVAERFGAEVKNVLTGFKYIGEYITELEENGEDERYILGMEESYGYLSGTHVRDKDAVVASAMICQMAQYYKSKGKSLYEVMNEAYERYGYYINSLGNFAFEGESGMNKMQQIMNNLRNNVPESFGGLKVLEVADYLKGEAVDIETGNTETLTLPKSNVLAFTLENSCSLIIRPSGTEPKIKCYYTAVSTKRPLAEEIIQKLDEDARRYLV